MEQANALLQKAGKAAKLTLSAETRPMRGGVVLKDGLVGDELLHWHNVSWPRPRFPARLRPPVWLRPEADVTEQKRK